MEITTEITFDMALSQPICVRTLAVPPGFVQDEWKRGLQYVLRQNSGKVCRQAEPYATNTPGRS